MRENHQWAVSWMPSTGDQAATQYMPWLGMEPWLLVHGLTLYHWATLAGQQEVLSTYTSLLIFHPERKWGSPKATQRGIPAVKGSKVQRKLWGSQLVSSGHCSHHIALPGEVCLVRIAVWLHSFLSSTQGEQGFNAHLFLSWTGKILTEETQQACTYYFQCHLPNNVVLRFKSAQRNISFSRQTSWH